ncbi:thiamine phosphate synthase [Pedobacter antarcticus]|uniref:thiamine phosphate synthase n=1 Tax=Pedobacter antarcticus TaxID=34086 RepID=UPI00292E5FB6|nr:thiamine phosphate synthase [Pedobacter antarcticus]
MKSICKPDFTSMQVLVISSPQLISGEARLINMLFEAGLPCFHLRKPGFGHEDLRSLIGGIDAVFHSRIAWHHHHEIAVDLGMNRLHFPVVHRNLSDRNNLSGLASNGYILSTSVHENESCTGLELFDYTFFGPVYNSLSKKGYQGICTEDFELDSRLKKCTRVIGLGGVTPEKIPLMRKMNFDGAAVLGLIWNEPERALEKYKNLLTALH